MLLMLLLLLLLLLLMLHILCQMIEMSIIALAGSSYAIRSDNKYKRTLYQEK
jgi:CBS domain containing-hemolysin-like protein